ncbi:MAG TPA: L,D-transpeptidase family protein [Trebonia sp.]|nr:L,D-transpeptidase family protein [Trebonia sp.]
MKPKVISAVLGSAAAALTFAGVLAGAAPGAAPGTAPVTATTVAAVSATGNASAVRLAAPAYTAPKRLLRYGLKGGDIKALQQRLAALKYYPGPADGQFGAYTLEAVWAFQEVQGLKVDGVVGPVTVRALQHPRAYPARYAGGGSTRVEVNLRTRVLVVYRGGAVALISHISAGGGYVYGGGARAVTPTGHFRTTVYLPGWIRVPLGTMYNSVFFIGTSYAIHGEPTYGANGGGVPLNPVSHGCVRIPYDIAQFFHALVKTPGTPVYVY